MATARIEYSDPKIVLTLSVEEAVMVAAIVGELAGDIAFPMYDALDVELDALGYTYAGEAFTSDDVIVAPADDHNMSFNPDDLVRQYLKDN